MGQGSVSSEQGEGEVAALVIQLHVRGRGRVI